MKQKLIGLFITLAVLFSPATLAATDIEIETAIQNGTAWLAAQQTAGGNWPHYGYPVATTCFALTKLQERAYELGYPSPFDPAYDYSDNVVAGWQYVLVHNSRTFSEAPLDVQDHTGGATGTDDNPDVNGNGYGVYFRDDGNHDIYTTGVCLMALYASGTPHRPNDGGLDYNDDSSPDTYLELAQEAVEWLAWAQNDGGAGEGSWYYWPSDNYAAYPFDGSIGGYAALGLALGEAFGATVPQWVKTEMEYAFINMQCYNGSSEDGGMSYNSPCQWVNQYKTGHLLWGLGFVGIAPSDQRFMDALAYIETNWRIANDDPGWGYNLAVADYQAMFVLMKAFEALNIELIDTNGDAVRDNDWFNEGQPATPAEDFATVIVAQQNADGSWPAVCNWGTAELCTTWALLTLERNIPKFIPEYKPVPTLSYWAYAVLTVLFVILAYVGMRRRFN